VCAFLWSLSFVGALFLRHFVGAHRSHLLGQAWAEGKGELAASRRARTVDRAMIYLSRSPAKND